MGQTKGEGLSRRSFLRGAGGMIALPAIISATALGAEGRPAASEPIVMGTIGFRIPVFTGTSLPLRKQGCFESYFKNRA